jgi:hypothetical protein
MLNKLNFTAKISFVFVCVSLFLFLFNYDSNSTAYFYGSGLPFTPSIFRFTDFFEISSIGFNNYQTGATNYFPFGIIIVNVIYSIFGFYSVWVVGIIFLLVLIRVISIFLNYSSYSDVFKFFLIIGIPILFVFDRGNINMLLYTIILSLIFLQKNSSHFFRALSLSFILSVKPTFVVVVIQILLSFKLTKKLVIYLVIFLFSFNLLAFLLYSVSPIGLLLTPQQFGGDPLLFVSRLSTNYIALFSGIIYSFNLDQLPFNLFITSHVPTIILLFSYMFSIFYLIFKRPILNWFNWIIIIAPTFLIFPIISFYYNVLILVPAFIFWLRSPSINITMARIESILFAIVFNSISWYHVPVTGYSSNSFMVSFSVIALFCISLLYVFNFSKKISNSSNSNNLST